MDLEVKKINVIDMTKEDLSIIIDELDNFICNDITIPNGNYEVIVPILYHSKNFGYKEEIKTSNNSFTILADFESSEILKVFCKANLSDIDKVISSYKKFLYKEESHKETERYISIVVYFRIK